MTKLERSKDTIKVVRKAQMVIFEGVYGLHLEFDDDNWQHISGECLEKISKALNIMGEK